MEASQTPPAFHEGDDVVTQSLRNMTRRYGLLMVGPEGLTDQWGVRLIPVDGSSVASMLFEGFTPATKADRPSNENL